MVIKIKFKLNDKLIEQNTFGEIIQLDNYNDIKYIDCYNNNLTSLPDNLPNSLERLWCYNNNLTNLPDNLPNSLKVLYCDNNPIYNFIQKYHNKNWKEYIQWKNKYKSPSNIIGKWFLECKYNPKYKYCKDRLNEEYDSLYSQQ